MVQLTFFILICLFEFIVIFIKWGNVSDAHEITKIISSATGFRKHYNQLIYKIVSFLKELKPLLWLVIALILIVNYVAALVLNLIYNIITFFI